MTVMVAAVLSVALCLAGVLGVMASWAGTAAHAQAVADLGSIAAATARLADREQPCDVAEELAAKESATLLRCDPGKRGEVEVTVVVTGLGGKHIGATSRAGPSG